MKHIAMALLVFVTACKEKTREEKMFGESHTDRAKLAVTKFAREAFPQWARANADKKCPGSIEELTTFMDTSSTRDPWGNAFVLTCSDGVVRVHSLGEDGKDGTGDDIKSWD